MATSTKHLSTCLLSASALGLIASAAFYPRVLAMATWDGRMESLPGPIMLWFTISLMLLAFGLAAAFVSAVWVRGGRGRLQHHGRKILTRVGLSTAGLAALIASIFAAVYVRRNGVEILARVNPDYPLYAELGPVRQQQGRAAALDRLADYFRSRPPPAFIKPVQLWQPAEALARYSREIASGAVPAFPDFRWRPGERVAWRCGATSDRKPLLFELQGQRFLFYLLGTPEDIPERQRIELAGAFAREWRRGNTVWPNSNRYAWNDDATSNRAQAHVYLMERTRRLGAISRSDELAFLKSLLQHADRLMDPSEYNARTNHGMMQNCALLTIALAYPEFDRGGLWRKTAVQRMQDYLLRYAVTNDGVFLELAPDYHFFATVQALWFYASCRGADVELEVAFEPLLRKMLVFCREILQPDGSLPMIADTHGRRPDLSPWPWEELPDWPELLKLRTSLAATGAPPNEPCARLWPRSGYFLLRAPTSEWTVASAMMLTFKASPRSRAHVHRDALSLTLFANGRPLLSGPGYPPYDQRRDELIATASQNTVSVDGRSQRAGDAEVVFHDSRCVMDAGREAPDFAVIKGRSLLYDGVRHDRTIIYGPAGKAVLVVDELASEQKHSYRQHFRPAPGLHGEAAPEGLLIGPDGAPNAGPLLRITTWQAGPSPRLVPAGRKRGDVCEFLVKADNATLVTLLDCSCGAEAGHVRIDENGIEWTGPRGRVAISLPILSLRSCTWSPHSKTKKTHSEHASPEWANRD